MRKLSSLIGLSHIKEKARILIGASQNTGEIFPHTLLHGVGGTGKTDIARAIGSELGYYFVETHAAAYKDRASLLTAIIRHNKCAGDVGKPLLFFVDETHRLRTLLQEALYSALAEWWLPTAGGRVHLQPFTFMGATTRLDMLDANSFLTRCENVWEVERYSETELAMIVAQVLSGLKIGFTREVTLAISKRCLGIPRTAISLAKKARRIPISEGRAELTEADVERMFIMERIDELGLNPDHHRYLGILAGTKRNGDYAAMGIGALAAKMFQNVDAISGTVEPLLLALDFVACTARGRVITVKGSDYFGKALDN